MGDIEKQYPIDLFKILNKILKNKFFIFKICLVFIVIGVITIITGPNEYKASTTVLPQNSGDALSGGLGSLASLAGVKLPGDTGIDSGITPSLYPQVVASIPFQKEILKTQIYAEEIDSFVSVEKYFMEVKRDSYATILKKYTLGLPGLIKKTLLNKEIKDFKNIDGQKSILIITEDEEELIIDLREKINVNIDVVDGYVNISCVMPNPYAAAQLTNSILELLQEYIIDFKVKSSREKMSFIEDRFNEKKIELDLVRSKLANYRDRNQNINTQIVRAKIDVLESEYGLMTSVFSNLAKQLETQRIKVKEDTPVFTVLNPVSLPLKKEGIGGAVKLVIWIIFGFIIGCLLLFYKNLLILIESKKDKFFN